MALSQIRHITHLGQGAAKFSTSSQLCEIRKMARLRVVDNSLLGEEARKANKPPVCIHVYTKTGVGKLGDKILVAVQGEKKKAFLVGCKQKQQTMVPRYDSNNIVFVEDNGVPTATRIRVPIPSMLRGKQGEFSKILAISSKFV